MSAVCVVHSNRHLPPHAPRGWDGYSRAHTGFTVWAPGDTQLLGRNDRVDDVSPQRKDAKAAPFASWDLAENGIG